MSMRFASFNFHPSQKHNKNSENGRKENYIKIEPKKIYKTLIISEKKDKKKKTAKKRYGGLILWVDGEFVEETNEKYLEIMGFESKRSDSSRLSRDVQRKVIRMLLEGKNIDELSSYIRGILSNLEKGMFDYEYIGIPRGLSKNLNNYKVDNPHRRGAFYSNKYLGASFGLGDKPKLIYISSTSTYPKTDVIAFQYNEDIPKDFVMDINLMKEKIIFQKIEHILDSSNISLDEILYNKTKLEDYF